MNPVLLNRVLGSLPRQTSQNVLVGFNTSDDAGVYKLDDSSALVQTVDFFTPIVDDPTTFGAVAAANALSDIYAMGGKPLSALAITCYPSNGNPEVLQQIMTGGLEKIREAGCVVIGGHSIADDEIKFGYAVTGLVNPNHIRTNAGAQPGDHLILTKKLGTGVISTALKKDLVPDEQIVALVESMTTLNAAAGHAVNRYEVHAVTDVTGFGLLGHALELAKASQVSLEIDHRAVDFLPGALEYAQQGIFPGGQKNNKVFASPSVDVHSNVPAEVEGLLYDPQTSGGLLISVAPKHREKLLNDLLTSDVRASTIGSVAAFNQSRIWVT